MNLKQAGILGFYAGAAVGGGVAFLVTRRRLRKRYEDIADAEIAYAREFYERKYKTKSPGELLEELHPEQTEMTTEIRQAVKDLGYSVVPESSEEDRSATIQSIHGTKPPKEDEESESLNVFRQRDKDREWDQEHEEAYRNQQPGIPFVISSEEFIENAENHEQVALTYWSGDDVLAESHGTGTESHIPDPDSIVGVENLDKFGYGSDDPNMVYVRNLRLGMDYEIVLQQGSYSKIVLGFDDSLEHADRPRNRQLRRFRE